MITVFYFIVFLLSLLMVGTIVFRNKKVDSLLVVFSLMITLNCFGRFLLSASTTLDLAIVSNKILYIGGCYSPLLAVFVLGRLCDVKIPRVFSVILICFSSIVLALVMTIGYSDIYYKKVELVYGNGYNYIIKTYGPAHALYPAMMLIFAAIMLFFLYYAIRKRNQLSFRIVLTLSMICFSIIFMYVFERVLDIKVSIMPVGYLIGITLLINYFDRLNMYDM